MYNNGNNYYEYKGVFQKCRNIIKREKEAEREKMRQLIKNRQKAIAALVKKHSFTEAEAIKAMNLFQKKYRKAQGKSGSGPSGAPH